MNSIKTERLSLQPLSDADAPAIFELRSNPTVNKFLDRKPPLKIDEAKAFIKKISQAVEKQESFYWGIHLSNKSQLIGTICLYNIIDNGQAEIGYELLPSFQGKGLMKEAILAVLNYAFNEVGLSLLEAYTHQENIPSLHLLEQAGFTEDKSRSDSSNIFILIYTLDRKRFLERITIKAT